MVISGDNPITVSKIAKMVEIPGAEKYIDATTLKTKEDLRMQLIITPSLVE